MWTFVAASFTHYVFQVRPCQSTFWVRSNKDKPWEWRFSRTFQKGQIVKMLGDGIFWHIYTWPVLHWLLGMWWCGFSKRLWIWREGSNNRPSEKGTKSQSSLFLPRFGYIFVRKQTNKQTSQIAPSIWLISRVLKSWFWQVLDFLILPFESDSVTNGLFTVKAVLKSLVSELFLLLIYSYRLQYYFFKCTFIQLFYT